jgi:hypothetical protein
MKNTYLKVTYVFECLDSLIPLYRMRPMYAVLVIDERPLGIHLNPTVLQFLTYSWVYTASVDYCDSR